MMEDWVMTCGCWDYAKEVYAIGAKREVMFLDGPGMVGCATCGRCADFLCDYPLGEGKTCSATLCETHARAIGGPDEDLHFCPAHAAMLTSRRPPDHPGSG